MIVANFEDLKEKFPYIFIETGWQKKDLNLYAGIGFIKGEEVPNNQANISEDSLVKLYDYWKTVQQGNEEFRKLHDK